MKNSNYFSLLFIWVIRFFSNLYLLDDGLEFWLRFMLRDEEKVRWFGRFLLIYKIWNFSYFLVQGRPTQMMSRATIMPNWLIKGEIFVNFSQIWLFVEEVEGPQMKALKGA